MSQLQSARQGQQPGMVPMTPEREAVAMSLQVLQTIGPVAVDNKLVEDDVHNLRQTAARTISAFIESNYKFEQAWAQEVARA